MATETDEINVPQCNAMHCLSSTWLGPRNVAHSVSLFIFSAEPTLAERLVDYYSVMFLLHQETNIWTACGWYEYDMSMLNRQTADKVWKVWKLLKVWKVWKLDFPTLVASCRSAAPESFAWATMSDKNGSVQMSAGQALKVKLTYANMEYSLLEHDRGDNDDAYSIIPLCILESRHNLCHGRMN